MNNFGLGWSCETLFVFCYTILLKQKKWFNSKEELEANLCQANPCQKNTIFDGICDE